MPNPDVQGVLGPSPAHNAPYTPSVPGNWSGAPSIPANVGQALDVIGSGVVGPRSNSGLSALRPAASGSGSFYLCTDIPVLYLDDPATKAWKQWAITPTPAPPTVANATAVGFCQGTQMADAISLSSYSDANSYGNCLLWPQALPAATAWRVTLAVKAVPGGYFTAGYPEVGVVVTTGTVSGTSQGYTLSAAYETNGWGAHGQQITVGAGGRSAVYNEHLQFPGPWQNGDGMTHLRLLNDTVQLHMQISPDGFRWIDWYSFPTPASLTNYGVYIGNDFTSGDALASALIYECVYDTNVTQYNLNGGTAATPAVCSTTSPITGLQTGDWVSIHGVVGNTNLNSPSALGSQFTPASPQVAANSSGVVIQVTGASQFTIPTLAGGPSAWTSGGLVTLLSR